MAGEDPFGAPDLGRTIIVPVPGGRARTNSPSRTAEPTATRFDSPVPATSDVKGGLNPLVAAANPLLRLVPQLRTTVSHPDPAALREQLVAALRRFESQARSNGVEEHKIRGATYVLATLLDETISSTPWGGSGVWGRQSLLVLFHNEAWGGEKFFQLLARLVENVPANRDLLELQYACLALGFEGRYRVIDNGVAQLEAVRQRLADLLRKHAGDYERSLSAQWKGQAAPRDSAISSAPLWIGVAIAGVTLLGIYMLLSLSLSSISEQVRDQIKAMRVKNTVVAEPAAAQSPRLAKLLDPEQKQGLVNVVDQRDSSTLTIVGDLFAPGSAAISDRYENLLGRIGEALASFPNGQVVVTGHTDNTPIRTLRFMSNADLSRARAQSVADAIASRVPHARILSKGAGADEPIGDNNTAAGRARNRRVEIVLYTRETQRQ